MPQWTILFHALTRALLRAQRRYLRAAKRRNASAPEYPHHVALRRRLARCRNHSQLTGRRRKNNSNCNTRHQKNAYDYDKSHDLAKSWKLPHPKHGVTKPSGDGNVDSQLTRRPAMRSRLLFSWVLSAVTSGLTALYAVNPTV
jgi:hypothetical protein